MMPTLINALSHVPREQSHGHACSYTSYVMYCGMATKTKRQNNFVPCYQHIMIYIPYFFSMGCFLKGYNSDQYFSKNFILKCNSSTSWTIYSLIRLQV